MSRQIWVNPSSPITEDIKLEGSPSSVRRMLRELDDADGDNPVYADATPAATPAATPHAHDTHSDANANQTPLPTPSSTISNGVAGRPSTVSDDGLEDEERLDHAIQKAHFEAEAAHQHRVNGQSVPANANATPNGSDKTSWRQFAHTLKGPLNMSSVKALNINGNGASAMEQPSPAGKAYRVNFLANAAANANVASAGGSSGTPKQILSMFGSPHSPSAAKSSPSPAPRQPSTPTPVSSAPLPPPAANSSTPKQGEPVRRIQRQALDNRFRQYQTLQATANTAHAAAAINATSDSSMAASSRSPNFITGRGQDPSASAFPTTRRRISISAVAANSQALAMMRDSLQRINAPGYGSNVANGTPQPTHQKRLSATYNTPGDIMLNRAKSMAVNVHEANDGMGPAAAPTPAKNRIFGAPHSPQSSFSPAHSPSSSFTLPSSIALSTPTNSASSSASLALEFHALRERMYAKEQDLIMAGEIGSILIDKNEEAYQRIDRLQAELDELNEQRERDRNEQKALERKEHRQDFLIKELEERMRSLTSDNDKMKSELDVAKASGDSKQKKLEERATAEDSKLDNFRSQVSTLEDRLSRATHQCEELKNEKLQLDGELAILRAELKDYQNEEDKWKRLEQKNAQLEDELAELKSNAPAQTSELQSKVSNLENSLSETQWENRRLSESVREFTSTLEQMRSAYEQLQTVHRKSQKDLTDAKAIMKKDRDRTHRKQISRNSFASLAEELKESTNEQSQSASSTTQLETPAKSHDNVPQSGAKIETIAAPSSDSVVTPSSSSSSPSSSSSAVPAVEPLSEPASASNSAVGSSPSPSIPPVVSVPDHSTRSAGVAGVISPTSPAALVASGRLLSSTAASMKTAAASGAAVHAARRLSLTVTKPSQRPKTPENSTQNNAQSKTESIGRVAINATPIKESQATARRAIAAPSTAPVSASASSASTPTSLLDSLVAFFKGASFSSSSSSPAPPPKPAAPSNSSSTASSAMPSPRIESRSPLRINAAPAASKAAFGGVHSSSSLSPAFPAPSPRSSRMWRENADLEFFSLTLLAIKLNSDRSMDIMYTLSTKELWEKARRLGVQFHQYHQFLQEEVTRASLRALYAMPMPHRSTRRFPGAGDEYVEGLAAASYAAMLECDEDADDAPAPAPAAVPSSGLPAPISSDDDKAKESEKDNETEWEEMSDDEEWRNRRFSMSEAYSPSNNNQSTAAASAPATATGTRSSIGHGRLHTPSLLNGTNSSAALVMSLPSAASTPTASLALSSNGTIASSSVSAAVSGAAQATAVSTPTGAAAGRQGYIGAVSGVAAAALAVAVNSNPSVNSNANSNANITAAANPTGSPFLGGIANPSSTTGENCSTTNNADDSAAHV